MDHLPAIMVLNHQRDQTILAPHPMQLLAAEDVFLALSVATNTTSRGELFLMHAQVQIVGMMLLIPT